MPEVHDVVAPVAHKDFSPKTKFVVTIGSQLIVGLLGVAVTAGVSIFIAKNINTLTSNED